MLPKSKTVYYYAITTCLISPIRSIDCFAHQLPNAIRNFSSIAIIRNPPCAFSLHVKSPYPIYGARTRTTRIASTSFSNRSSTTCNHISPNSRLHLHLGTFSSSNTTQRNMSSDSPHEDDIATNISNVQSRILQTLQDCNRPSESVRLVAVSKTKPVELLMEAYNAGQRHFGENYAQELIQKADEMPSDIKWHFIGPLQSNKAGPLVKSLGLKKLVCVETVSTMKLAQKLDHAVRAWIEQQQQQQQGEESESILNGQEEPKLGIYIQVNTSGEDTKSGVSDEKECAALAKEIAESCPNLRIDGLMTIGAPGDLSCFDLLVECRKSVAEILSVDVDSLELSMGMSGDYVEAIQRGATSVRVGSTIFGARDYSNKSTK